MEAKAYGHILRNKLLFNWTPTLRPLVYRFYRPSEAPVFVLGNQKSGTSAVAALLARACGLSYDIDLGGLRVPEYARIYADRGQLPAVFRDRAAIEFSKQLVKEPNLTFLLSEIQALYPRSRHAFVIRDPRANIRSICNRLELPGDLPAIRPEDYPEISPMWRAILFNEWVGDAARDLNYIGRSAERWRIAANLCLAAGPATQPIRYEDFVTDKLATIHDLSDRLGLEVRHDIVPYLDVQYQQAGKKVTDYRAFFGEENLTTILTECAETMNALGYQNTRP